MPDQSPPPTQSKSGTMTRHNRNGRITGNIPTDVVLERERQVLDLKRKHPDMSWQKIADEVGYADRKSAWDAYYRALGRHTKADVTELRQAASAREHDLLHAVWDKASAGDSVAVRDALQVEQRLARLHGYDHADGVAERIVAMEAAKLRMVALALGGALEELGLTEEQATTAKRRLFEKLRDMTAMAEGDADAAIAEVEGSSGESA